MSMVKNTYNSEVCSK